MIPAARASSTGSAAAGTPNAPAAPAPMSGLTLIAASPPAGRRGWAPSSAPVARPSPSACTASATATAGAGQRDGRAFQEAVDRQRRRRACAAGLLSVFLAAAPGAGGRPAAVKAPAAAIGTRAGRIRAALARARRRGAGGNPR